MLCTLNGTACIVVLVVVLVVVFVVVLVVVFEANIILQPPYSVYPVSKNKTTNPIEDSGFACLHCFLSMSKTSQNIDSILCEIVL